MTTDNVAAINGETPIYIIGIYIITTTANVNISASTELKPFFPPTSHISPKNAANNAIILLADFQKKSIGAMLGTIAGVVVSGLIALVFGHFGHVTGYNVDDIENLIYVGQNSKLDIGGMLFSLISCNDDETDIATSITAPNDAISIPENSIPPMSSFEFWPTYQQGKYSVQELILDEI